MPTAQPSPVPPPLNQHSQVGALQYGGSFPIGCGPAVDPCIAHIAAGQARAEAPANSLIKVDVDADTNPRDLDPDKLDLYDSFDDSFDTNDAHSLVRNRSGSEGDTATYPFLMFSWRVFHCQREHHYEPQERARILALDQAIMRQCSTIEVELLYVDQRWCTIRARHLPAEKCADTRNKGVRGCCWMKEPPIAPAFMSCCFSKELGAASEMAPTCQRTSLAQNSSVGMSQAAPGPRSRSPVKTRPRNADFPDGPSKEPPGIVLRPSIETCRHQTDFHYGYQNVSQDPNSKHAAVTQRVVAVPAGRGRGAMGTMNEEVGIRYA
ncbi:hypothetical protein B0H17DRAFT_1151599 [Mycena rosella]|uniref:Uncharacterized protein n=1 Tax=Mycena rosella TaxID=1033263 RepID=A0AAD7BJE4_MYCRO|nr:hypothetical protein B0H17DRAFT_1151599 [Mycena rosella]